jgi:hypothetical protein
MAYNQPLIIHMALCWLVSFDYHLVTFYGIHRRTFIYLVLLEVTDKASLIYHFRIFVSSIKLS